jgi:predicted transcriptional regulator
VISLFDLVGRGVISHRNKTDIVIQILEIANGSGVTKFKISSRGFLNYEKLGRYLTMLIESGLLKYDAIMCTFKTTEKGLVVVQAYNQMSQILK